MIKTKLIAGILAGSLFLGLMPQESFASEPSSGRTKWEGYDTSEMNFSVWNGQTYDTSWYTGENGRQVHAGTEDDPYLIEDADDLAGLKLLTDNKNNSNYLRLDAPDITVTKSKSIFDTSYAFWDITKDPYEAESYLFWNSETHRGSSLVSPYALSVEFEGYSVQQDEEVEYNGRKGKPYYFKVTQCNITIGEHTVAIRDYNQIDSIINLSPKYAYRVQPISQDFIDSATSGLDIYWVPFSYSTVGVNYEDLINASEVDWDAKTIAFTESVVIPLADFDISFSGFRVTDIRNNITTLDSTAIDKYIPCTITREGYTKNSWIDCYAGSPDQLSKDKLVLSPTVTQTSEVSPAYTFMYDRHYYPTTAYFKDENDLISSCTISDTTRADVGLYKTYVNITRRTSSSNYLITLGITPYKYLGYGNPSSLSGGTSVGYYTSNLGITNTQLENRKRFVWEYTLEDEHLLTIALKGIVLQDDTVKNFTRTFKITYDLWKMYSTDFLTNMNNSSLQLVGFKKDLTGRVNQQEVLTANPSFEGKFIKLMSNIDLADNRLTIFPISYRNGYGLSCDFNLNGKVIRNIQAETEINSNGYTRATQFIRQLNARGKVHNGIITTSMTGSVTLVQYNYGALTDITLCVDNMFDLNNMVPHPAAVDAVNNNLGIIDNLRVICSAGCYANLCGTNTAEGVIRNIDCLIVDSTNPNLADSSTSLFTVARGNYGLIDTINIDADSDIVGSSEKPVAFYGVVGQEVTGSWGLTQGYGVTKNVYIADFDIYARYFSPMPFMGSLDSCSTYIDNLYPVSRGVSVNGSVFYGGGYMRNCTIVSDMGYSYGFSNLVYLTDIDDCDINVEYDCTGLSAQCHFNCNNMRRTKLHIKTKNGSYSKRTVGQAWDSDRLCSFTDCDITLEGASSSQEDYCYDPLLSGKKMVNCNVNLINVNAQLSILSIDEIVNSKVNALVAGKYLSPIVGGSNSGKVPVIKGSSFNIEYKDITAFSSYFYGGKFINSNCFVHFDESCTYEGYAGQSNPEIGIASLEQSLCVMTNDSETMVLGSLVGSPYVSGSIFMNSTLLADNFCLATGIMPKYMFSSSSGAEESIDNFSVYNTNMSVKNSQNTLYLLPETNPVDGAFRNIVWNIQLKDPTVGICFFDENVPSNKSLFSITNVAVKSNTENPNSRMLDFGQSALSQTINGMQSIIVKNCYFDIRNAQNSLAPSETAEGLIPGVMSAEYYEQAGAGKHKASSWIMKDYVKFDNIIVPAGSSTVAQYYCADTTTPDSWNISTCIHDIANIDNNEDLVGAVLDNCELPGTVYIDNPDEAALDGTLAYMLDKGGSQYRRTRNWSVLEEDVIIRNPLTDEVSEVTIPAGLALANIYLPEACLLEQRPDTSPIYKVTIEPADNGEVIAEGLNGTLSTNDSIFVKQGTSLDTTETAFSSEYTFAYATQAFYTGLPSRIPSTGQNSTTYNFRQRSRNNSTGYTINGYYINASDVDITPVFKVARYITVDIENEDKGTIIPSAYISTSGETIALKQAVEDNYIVTDIKINGQPLTGSKFIMPDENVTITGKAVPFEGGITKFSVFGFDGVIDQIAHTIEVNVPRMGNISNALAEVEYKGDFITPSLDSRVDFSSPVTYTVTYGEGKTTDYLVTVTQSEYAMRITDFVINGKHADINQTLREISLVLPLGTDLSSLTPEISYSAEIISPESGVALDFQIPQVYTLYARGMSNVSYTVTITTEADSIAEITRYNYSGYEGIIDNQNSTITLTVPAALNISNITPSILNYRGKTITPGKLASINPESDTSNYIVEAQNGIQHGYKLKINTLADDTARITKFVLGGSEGIIDESTRTITVTVPRGTQLVDVVPNVLLYEGKSIYPGITVEQDFTQPITYTVVAPDNSEKEYTVIVNTINSEALITYFALYGIAGDIDQVAKTIHVSLPSGFTIDSVVPSSIVYSEGATLAPNEATSMDFTTPQIYKVTSEDGFTINTYTVYVSVGPSEPDQPTKPDEPDQPDEPDVPDKPDKPDEPNQPDEPIEPTEPTKPDQPTEPIKPDEPEEPIKPDKPEEPDKPGDNENPNTGNTTGRVLQSLVFLAFISGGLVGISAKRKPK